MSYDPHAVEEKWKTRWEAANIYVAENDSDRPKYYVLDMFPYPSGSGLHVGHASGYVATDVIARRKRMEGFNVLHPMGWDAFGLPAEQFAIQTGQHPRNTTDINTANFRKQLRRLGLSYDWSREVDTSDPRYYRWTQWIFLRLFERGLAYRKEMPVWWCEDLKTVLANEEVINGRSERGNHPCERRMVSQWVLRITAYADRLLADLDELDWPEGVKKMQRDWIGRSTGCNVRFQLDGSDGDAIDIFTTRVETLFGVTALVLAPEHPLASQLAIDAMRKEVASYLERASSKSERERKADSGSIIAQFTGRYAAHPLQQDLRIPVYIADYVLPDYGTGAVMAVPAHDERDHRFALAAGLGIVPVVAPHDDAAAGAAPGDGYLINSPGFDGLHTEVARGRIAERLEEVGRGAAAVSYRLRDWVFSRQRYWGEPIPLCLDGHGDAHAVEDVDLPVILPLVENFAPGADGSSPLMRAGDWRWLKSVDGGPFLERVTDTMPGWAGSCWYYLRFMDPGNDDAPFSRDAVQYWRDVDLYVGGASHAVMHLLYARFWHKVLFDLDLVPTKEPFRKLFNQGMVTSYAFRDTTGRLVPVDEVEQAGGGWRRRGGGESLERFGAKMAKSLRNVVNPDDVVARRGCDAFRLYALFMGPLDADKPWADDGIPGCEKFLRRVWGLFMDHAELLQREGDEHGHVSVDRILDRCLDKVDRAFDAFNFNTAVAAMMEAVNELLRAPARMSRGQCETFVRMLSPFAPFMAAELWERLGHTSWVDFQPWPELDRARLGDEHFELVIQVNGRVRGRCSVPVGTSHDEVRTIAHCEVADWLEGNTIGREVYVPGKLYNFALA